MTASQYASGLIRKAHIGLVTYAVLFCAVMAGVLVRVLVDGGFR